MSNYVSVIFCRNCHSRYVEIVTWPDRDTCELHCRTCDVREQVKSFTLGRCKVDNNQLQAARDTRAVPGKPER